MKALYYFFTFLFICLLGAMFYIFKDANNIQSDGGKIDLSPEFFLTKLEDIVNTSWSKSLAEKKTPTDRPIANELYINLQLQDVQDLIKKRYYKLEIDKNDKYSMFCVKQALANNSLKYFLITNKKESQIIIDVQDYSKLHMLVDELKDNQIGSDFIEIWL